MKTHPSPPSHLLLFASAPAIEVLSLDAAQPLSIPGDAAAPLPTEFVWMPSGEHQISATGTDGKAWVGKVTCDAAGAAAVQAQFNKVLASGRRVYLDENHEDAAATAWVTAFSWDPARGILVHVQWTALGEQLLRGRIYHSFSPAFLLARATGRVSGFPLGHAAGGLVNAPAFGAAMPALIAARLSTSSSSEQSASGGTPDNQTKSAMNKELILAILAALAVQVPADATDEQVQSLLAQHKERLIEAAKTNLALKAKLGELETIQAKASAEHTELLTLRARESDRRKADAKAAVDAAVARGALPPKDEAIQAKWRGMIEANPDHADLLRSLPDNPALTRVTEATAGLQAKDNLLPILQSLKAKSAAAVDERALIFARDIGPVLAKPGFLLGPILAANSLGTLSGELVTQRSLTLLKRSFPAIFALSTDFSDVAAKLNQTIQARLRTIPTVTEFDPDDGYVTGSATTTDVPVVIDKHMYTQIGFGVNELAATNRDLFGEQVEGAHNAIGADLVDAVLAIITAANFADPTLTTTVALNAFARSSLTGIAKKLTNRHVGRAGRFCMLNTDYYEKIGQDTSIISLATFQQAQIITEGQLPRIAGLQPYEVESFPTTGNLVGFAGAADAIAVATRVPNDYTQAMPDVPSNGSVQIVKNMDTGMSVMLVRFVDHTMGTAAWRLAYMRGAAKGQVASGERIISATPGS